jgi:preprotein translocase subunit SecD
LLLQLVVLALCLAGAGCSGDGDDDGSDEAVRPVATDDQVDRCASLGGELVSFSQTLEPVPVYCLGPELVSAATIESVDIEFREGAGWFVLPVFFPGPEGIDQFNAAALDCFNASPACPLQQLAVVADGLVVSAPVINAPVFGRDHIQISVPFSEEVARQVAEGLASSGSFRPVMAMLD